MDILSFFSNYILLFLVLMSLLVFVHEYGHYGIARLLGVKAEIFSIGFGPEIIGWTNRHSGTRWRFSAVPLGGYVKFIGDMTPSSAGGPDASLPAELRPYAFHLQPVWKRAAIVAAGPGANLVFAWVLTAFMLFAFGQAITPAVVGAVDPTGPAARAGIRAGDTLISFDGTPIRRFEEFEQEVQIRPNTTVEIGYRRDGKEHLVTLVLDQRQFIDRFRNLHRLGTAGLYGPNEMPVVGKVLADSPAELAGFKTGDHVVEIAGQKVARFADIPRLVGVRNGLETPVVVERNGRPQALTVVPRAIKVDGEPADAVPVGRIGIMSGFFTETAHFDLLSAPIVAARTIVRECSAFYTLMRQLVLGMRPLDELSGPMRMAKATGEVAQLGWTAVLGFAIIISVLLGLFNLLPVPLLDGGHLLYYAIEWILGRPLGQRAQEYGFRFGFLLVVCATLLATWNDVSHIFGFLVP